MGHDEHLPPRLQEIVEDFEFLQGREKLEYLLEFAQKLPPLPAWLASEREKMEQVHECMTPVFVHAERRNGSVAFYFDVPAESPTVRGFASILREGTEGLDADEVLAIPNEFYLRMGLQNVLSGQRLNGMGAILRYIKRLADALAVEDGA
jgi:cysteine desulfuration protein SufE